LGSEWREESCHTDSDSTIDFDPTE